MILLGISFLALFFFFCSCNSKKNRNTEKITVASEQADCVGVGTMKCLLVKNNGDEEWEFFYNNIEGFSYEPGFEYKLEIRKEFRDNPAADQSSTRYVLVRVISKVQKRSDNLPVIPIQFH